MFSLRKSSRASLPDYLLPCAASCGDRDPTFSLRGCFYRAISIVRPGCAVAANKSRETRDELAAILHPIRFLPLGDHAKTATRGEAFRSANQGDWRFVRAITARRNEVACFGIYFANQKEKAASRSMRTTCGFWLESQQPHFFGQQFASLVTRKTAFLGIFATFRPKSGLIGCF